MHICTSIRTVGSWTCGLCAERVVGDEPFAVLLADDFVTYEGLGVTADLAKAFQTSGKTQLSVMEVSHSDIHKYGEVVPGHEPNSVAGLVEKPEADKAPSNLASIGRYILTPDIFDILQSNCRYGEKLLADAINTQAKNNGVEAVMLDGGRRIVVVFKGIWKLSCTLQLVDSAKIFKKLNRTKDCSKMSSKQCVVFTTRFTFMIYPKQTSLIFIGFNVP